MASTDRKTGGIKAIRLRRAGPEKPKKVKQPKPVATQMTFFEHLGELRNRLMWSSLAVVICTAAAWFFHEDLLAAFLDLAKKNFPSVHFINIDVTQSFGVYFELC